MGDGTYGLQNALGLRLTAHRNSNSTSLTAQEALASEQNFYIDMVDYPFFKILASKGRSHGFDLSNESTAAGTTVTVWQYQDSNPTPIHRQWTLLPLKASLIVNGIEEIPQYRNDQPAKGKCFDISGRQLKGQPKRGLYIVDGRKVAIQ